MTLQVNIAEAKAKLSELVARAEAGEDVIIARGGKPIVTLKLLPAVAKAKRVAGAWAHLGRLEDPYLFLGSDPEMVEAAESSDEDEFYQP
ncbi:type II toxin-antitoxin system Phd/YefM family antitoxin [Phenylobacterium sp.]|uniref:type II toxin-antitoxin system Phd/YefM family antitoxin n=1 Tax=Phenylobacterium sp. TaxID=1871053 RepID=UPI0039836E19